MKKNLYFRAESVDYTKSVLMWIYMIVNKGTAFNIRMNSAMSMLLDDCSFCKKQCPEGLFTIIKTKEP